jgi:hypothetical protein
MSSSRNRNSVQAGVCFDNTSKNCALEATACTDPNTFMSSRELLSVANAHGGNCLKSEFVNSIAIGRCVGPGGDSHCASDPALCVSDTTFTTAMADADSLPGCKVRQQGTGGQGLPTAYGRCGNVDCVWSSDDCGEAFELDPTCTCEKVIVGACEKDGMLFCSVSPTSCDDESQWMTPQQLRLQTNTDCYLCREFEDPSISKPEPTLPATNASSSDSFGRSALIGGLVGGLLGVLLVGTLVMMFTMKHAGGKKSLSEQNSQPPSEVAMSSEDMSEIGDEIN